MATYWENSCSFGLRYVSWYKYLIVSLVFSHLSFWSGNLFLIAPFPDLCLLVPFVSSGTLHVNTEIDIDQNSSGPNNCLLIFQWRSKTKTLLALDKLLLQKPQSVSSLTTYVDFIPALETGARDRQDFFIINKWCIKNANYK